LIGIHDLPAVNATLNATSAILLTTGYTLIRRRKIAQHKRVMIAAFCVSIAFLICYLIYHSQVGSVRFRGTGPLRTTYLSILFTHTILAAAVPILAVITLIRGLKRKDAKHRAVARWTLPIWLYVSVTGVVVYLMLYKM